MSDVVRQVDGFEVSAERIAAAVKSQPSDNVVIVAAHNGPFGLGSLHHNICGADFKLKKAGNPRADFFFPLEEHPPHAPQLVCNTRKLHL